VNGGELPNVPVPDSVVYDVLSQDGDSLRVTIDVGGGSWWTYTLARVNDTAALAGKWRLNTDGGAGVGPAAGDISWWSTDIDGVVETRACWFDDVVEFGPDGSFANDQGDETWLETWQGVGAESCGAPVAPHDGSARAIFEYDDAAGTLTVHGTGAHLGLPRTVNGADLTTPAEAPESVIYDVLTLDGDNITVTLETAAGNWWTYKYVRVSNSPWVGNWKLDLNGGAGVGPAAGDISWWSTDIDGVIETRACWFDDVFHFGGGGNFQNFQDGETWLEDWQAGAEQCGAPLAPHDGSTTGVWRNDDVAGTLTISGVGSHVGLPRTVNGGELPNVPVPEAVTYDVLSFDLGAMTLTIDVGGGSWWTYKLARE
ncbi:MAG: glycoside hydrolase family 16 protein, partial [Gammaproteobacteria bacterium]|nr:glycoside hydrolase family 16 protein [Gammaproteobacteria bacterium]